MPRMTGYETKRDKYNHNGDREEKTMGQMVYEFITNVSWDNLYSIVADTTINSAFQDKQQSPCSFWQECNNYSRQRTKLRKQWRNTASMLGDICKSKKKEIEKGLGRIKK